MARVLVINGSYREDGITDRSTQAIVETLQAAGAETEVVLLRDYPIEFCLNCRECTQQPGEEPGTCFQQDGMQALIERIERADAFVLASPTNLGSVTAMFKRFMERLAVYAYWPWGMKYPQMRKAGRLHKKAVLVSSCAAPGTLGRWIYSTHGQLKTTARAIGATPVGTLFTGQIALDPHAPLPARALARAEKLANRLI